MKRTIILAICALVSFGCSTDPRDVRITAKNKDTFMDEIKDMKGLTVDEARLLVGFQIRQGMSSALGGKSQDPTGKTVGQLLTELKKQAAEEKTEADRQKRLADEAKAKANALAAELRKSVDLTVYDKGFIPSNPTAGRFSDNLTIRCAYQNNSSKDIRAFRGKIELPTYLDQKSIRPMSRFPTQLVLARKGIGMGRLNTTSSILRINGLRTPN